MRRRAVTLAAVFALVAAACTTRGDDGTYESAGTLERYLGYDSEIYADPAHWICSPDDDTDLCAGGLDATVVEADGTLTVEEWEPESDPPIDCFYIYPTISRDESTNSDLEWAEDEEGLPVRNQVARLGEVCDVYAPVYRQTTLTALVRGLSGEGGGFTEESREIAFGDVLDAWRHYMAHDNEGRGVVLVGHSQGSGMLTMLLAEEIEPNEDVRDLLVSAYLAGSSVRVPEGEVVGGDFEDIPLCESEDQFGCIVTWSSYRDSEPPSEGAFFGRPRSGDGVAGCVSPAAVGGGSAQLRAYFPAERGGSILTGEAGGDDDPWVHPGAGEVTTPFVTLPGMLEGECVTRDGFDYLEITVASDPFDLRAHDIRGDLTPEWGLHLVDVNLVMGDMLELIEQQSAGWIAAR